jgi:hypothetical protein
MSDGLTGSDPEVRGIVRRLLEVGAQSRPDIDRAILDRQAAAVPALVEILEDEALALMTAPGAGHAPIHAARLLGAIGAIEAIEPLLRAIIATYFLDELTAEVTTVLPTFGAPVIEPALRAYAASPDPAYRARVAAVLAEVRIHDDRIFAILVEQVRAEPGRADLLGFYGDPRALPVLIEELDRYEIMEGANPLSNHTLIELRAAIEMLGGTLTEAQQRKYARGADAANRFRRKIGGFRTAARFAGSGEFVQPAPSAPRADRPGRNDPCWCGNGKKYKKCHLASDEDGTSQP